MTGDNGYLSVIKENYRGQIDSLERLAGLYPPIPHDADEIPFNAITIPLYEIARFYSLTSTKKKKSLVAEFEAVSKIWKISRVNHLRMLRPNLSRQDPSLLKELENICEKEIKKLQGIFRQILRHSLFDEGARYRTRDGDFRKAHYDRK